MDSLKFKTSDGVELAADFYEAEGDRFALLLHMMPVTKESWVDFARALQQKGISSLAFDQRGHGQSTGGPSGYKEFTDAEQQSKVRDVEAALKELELRGAIKEKIVIIGASIGANFTITQLVEHPDFHVGVALSPGIDYRGVRTDSAVKKLNKNQSLMVVASEEDTYSFDTNKKLHQLQPIITLVEKSGLGHGTTMFEKDSSLMQDVVQWIDEML